MRMIAVAAAAASLVSVTACTQKNDAAAPAAEPATTADAQAAPADDVMASDAPADESTPGDIAVVEPITDEECYASEPAGGVATLDLMPGVNNNPTLKISFTVTGRTAGDAFALEYVSSEEMAPPNYVFDLVRTASGGAEVITPGIAVDYSEENLADREINVAKIMCGGAAFYELAVDEIQ